MDKRVRKEMQNKYKERKILGGVYVITNTLKNKMYVDVDVNLYGIKNRFEFAVKTGAAVHMALQEDWIKQGGKDFKFQILEKLKKNDIQSMAEFKRKLKVLKEMWLEKMASENLY